MNQRIFFAIQISPQIKKQLASFQYRWLNLPVRWVAKENFHITLLFLGQKKIEEIARISELIHQVAHRHSSFFLTFKQVQLQPNANRPTTFWVRGEENSVFSKLVQDLETSLKTERLYFSTGSSAKKQVPHITLGRVRRWQWIQLELEERPEIEETFSLKIPVKKITLVESKLRRRGPEYITLETAVLDSK